MISKIVHNHLPEKQYAHPCLQKFCVEKLDISEGEQMINIDNM